MSRKKKPIIETKERLLSRLSVILIFASLGLAVLRVGSAATTVIATEAESGTVAGSASVENMSAVSGGKAVTFGMFGQPVEGRLFGVSSPWNVPANGNADPRSNDYITSGSQGSLKYSFTQTGRGFDIAGTDEYPDYGVPMYKVGTSTPLVQVKDKYGWWGGPMVAPVPADAKPAVGTDHHLAVWDTELHTIYEFWEMTKNTDGTWTAGAAAKFDTNGPGYQSTPWAVSARAYGGSLMSGAILYDEMKAGVIEHALGMAYPWTLGKKYAMGLGTDGKTMNIASHSDNAEGTTRNGATNIPEGARFRLKSSVDVNARCGTNNACKIIGTALKKYGAYVVDTAGVATFYAEVLTNKPQKWQGVLSATDARAFQAEDFELLALPPTLTPTPGN